MLMRKLIKDADSRIGGGARRVARQKELIDGLRAAGHDVALARELLEQHQKCLRQYIVHRGLLQRELHLLCRRLLARRKSDESILRRGVDRHQTAPERINTYKTG